MLCAQRCFKTLTLALVVIAQLSFVAIAAPHDAAVHLNEVDADFAYQGEYYGTVFNGQQVGGWRTVGLQVIARGEGEFEAVLYSGGLPGAGWRGAVKRKLYGTRDESTVVLKGSGYRMVLENGAAQVFGDDWEPLGQIAKTARVSPTFNTPPPWGARVLFNGYDTDNFVNGRMTRDALLMEGTQLKEAFRDYTLHVEFRLPYMPTARGQGRSNSGVYLQSRYEVQILDSFGLEGEHNECGGLYKYRRPNVNMCYPPLSWQTYDIVFTAPRFDAYGNKSANARLTVYHNGVAIHNNVSVMRKTGGGAQEGPNPLPIKLQDHHNPVRFRNIWIVDDTKPTGSPYPPYARTNTGYEPYGVYLPPPKRAYWLR
jgi:hypothetical protein